MTNRKTCEMYKQHGIQGIYQCSECFYCKNVRHEHYCTYDKMFEIEGNNKACGAFLHRIEK